MADTGQATSIDAYIATFPEPTRVLLEQLRRTIGDAAPAAMETISYGIPTFDLAGKHLVFFAGWKRHLSLYPLPAGDTQFQAELARYRRAKGTIQLPLDSPIPTAFVARLVRFLVAERTAGDRRAVLG